MPGAAASSCGGHLRGGDEARLLPCVRCQKSRKDGAAVCCRRRLPRRATLRMPCIQQQAQQLVMPVAGQAAAGSRRSRRSPAKAGQRQATLRRPAQQVCCTLHAACRRGLGQRQRSCAAGGDAPRRTGPCVQQRAQQGPCM